MRVYQLTMSEADQIRKIKLTSGVTVVPCDHGTGPIVEESVVLANPELQSFLTGKSPVSIATENEVLDEFRKLNASEKEKALASVKASKDSISK